MAYGSRPTCDERTILRGGAKVEKRRNSEGSSSAKNTRNRNWNFNRKGSGILVSRRDMSGGYGADVTTSTALYDQRVHVHSFNKEKAGTKK